jgi:hypothetical protein
MQKKTTRKKAPAKTIEKKEVVTAVAKSDAPIAQVVAETTISQESIQKRAFFLWHNDGRHHNRSLDYWIMAEAQLAKCGLAD